MHGVVGEGCEAVRGVEGHRIDVERVNYHRLEANLPTRGDEAPKGMHEQLATNTSTRSARPPQDVQGALLGWGIASSGTRWDAQPQEKPERSIARGNETISTGRMPSATLAPPSLS